MGKGNVKIVVDYKNGTYDVIGLHNKEVTTIHTPIRVNGKGESEDNFSRKLIRAKRKEMRQKLKEIRKNNPRFIYSRSMVRKVDPLIYKALEEWDSMAKTTYATDYLQTITQSFDWLERPELSDKEVEERSRNIRRSGLVGHGIDISYNVGLFKTNKQLTFIDKIKGIHFARIQRKLLDVELQNSLVLKPDYYLREINQFVYDIERYQDEEDILSNIREVFAEIEKENEKAETPKDKEVINYIQSVFAEIEEERLLGIKLEDKDVLARIREILISLEDRKTGESPLRDKEVLRRIREALEKEEEKVAEKEPAKEKETLKSIYATAKKDETAGNIFQDKEVQRRIRETLAKEEAKKAEEARRIEEIEQAEKRAQEDKELNRLVLEALGEIDKPEPEPEKKTLTKPKIEESKKGKKYKNNKKRVRNHTGERVSLTKKQRESIARKERKEQNSHYNTQMRLKAEKEEKQRQAAERIAKYQEEKKLEEERIAEENRRAEEARRAEEERIAEEKRKAEELRIAEEAKANRKHLTRKVDDEKDSVKNKSFIHKEENKTRTLKIKLEKAKRRVQAEVRYWKRKLHSAADSIRNKKFKPMAERTKRRIITGAVTVLTVGIILAGARGSNTNITDMIGSRGVVASPEVVMVQDASATPAPEATVTPEVTPAPVATPTPEVTPAPAATPAPEVTPAPETIPDSEVAPEPETIPDPDNQISTGLGHSEAESGDSTEIVETDEEKIERFRQEALQMYEDALIIGETPQIGDILMDQTYCESPSGVGKVGYFKSHPNYKISHINIVTPKGWKVVRTEGKSLSELLAEYPECVTYNIGFVDSKTGGGLGFVTKEQYDEMVQNKINEIINSRMDKDTDLDLDTDDLIK